MKLTMIGLGLIGGSLAIDLRARGFVSSIVGVDRDEGHCRQARNRGLVDEIRPLEEALIGSDLVVLATPVNVVVRLLPEVLDRVGPLTTVTDMGSTKQAICAAVASHPHRAQFVASHPMAGTENSGPMAAISGMFGNRTAVICDADDSAPAHLRRIDEMYRILGMRLVHMSSAEHDLHAAFVSHLSHISSFVLANTVLDKEKNVATIFDLAGGGFESTVRLAKSSPEMWTPIFDQNRTHVIAALEAYLDHLQQFHRSLVKGDPEETKTLMRDANEIRRVLQAMGTRSGAGKN